MQELISRYEFKKSVLFHTGEKSVKNYTSLKLLTVILYALMTTKMGLRKVCDGLGSKMNYWCHHSKQSISRNNFVLFPSLQTTWRDFFTRYSSMLWWPNPFWWRPVLYHCINWSICRYPSAWSEKLCSREHSSSRLLKYLSIIPFCPGVHGVMNSRTRLDPWQAARNRRRWNTGPMLLGITVPSPWIRRCRNVSDTRPRKSVELGEKVAEVKIHNRLMRDRGSKAPPRDDPFHHLRSEQGSYPSPTKRYSFHIDSWWRFTLRSLMADDTLRLAGDSSAIIYPTGTCAYSYTPFPYELDQTILEVIWKNKSDFTLSSRLFPREKNIWYCYWTPDKNYFLVMLPLQEYYVWLWRREAP